VAARLPEDAGRAAPSGPQPGQEAQKLTARRSVYSARCGAQCGVRVCLPYPVVSAFSDISASTKVTTL
ncbi:MAG TPA: hypothetical protein VEJ84_05700, partial [Acidimicrobiales bacterium]|nr:hypothetical protein [Acidimicrobiales bacterium]